MNVSSKPDISTQSSPLETILAKINNPDQFTPASIAIYETLQQDEPPYADEYQATHQDADAIEVFLHYQQTQEQLLNYQLEKYKSRKIIMEGNLQAKNYDEMRLSLIELGIFNSYRHLEHTPDYQIQGIYRQQLQKTEQLITTTRNDLNRFKEFNTHPHITRLRESFE